MLFENTTGIELPVFIPETHPALYKNVKPGETVELPEENGFLLKFTPVKGKKRSENPKEGEEEHEAEEGRLGNRRVETKKLRKRNRR